MDKKELLKQIPKVDLLLDKYKDRNFNAAVLKFCIGSVLDRLRTEILEERCRRIDKGVMETEIENQYFSFLEGSLKEVVNATGIVIHTNLGRAPLSNDDLSTGAGIISGYSNLEYDLNECIRGDRYHHLSGYLSYLTGAEDSLIVNNNAAAVFLILNTFCKNRECVVSRGELVEIGGSFRIPEVMANSGASLKEVGTTNKTRVSDYTNAVTENTSLFMKVHKSNYVIEGFSEETSLEEVAKKAEENSILSYYDLGSGKMLSGSGNDCREPSVRDILKKGVDIVSFSGDKMLGGVQSGIILGKKELIERLKQNQLMRMLRVDKVTLAILQSLLRKYIFNDTNAVKTLEMISEDVDSLQYRAEKLKFCIKREVPQLSCNTEKVFSYTGGGSCPMSEIESRAVTVFPGDRHVSELETGLRKYRMPVICRIKNNKLIFDLRTISPDQYEIISEALAWVLKV